jgi:hypothetical protein
MNQQFAPDRIAGYPSFISRDTTGLNWWLPERSGDAISDYCAGEEHLAAAIDLVDAVRNPFILANIVGSMRVMDPMECGFIDALASKAMTGRAPPSTDPRDEKLSDAFRWGEAHAHTCLALARIWEMPSLISDDLTGIVVDQTYKGDFAVAFIWTVCVTATTGALN